MGGGSISAVKEPAVSLQDFDDVVKSGLVGEDANLDLIQGLYSDKAISHTGTWRRSWLPASDWDKKRSVEIRCALADAIRFKADVASGKMTGNPTLDEILRRIETSTTPLTKREVRQVLGEVGKIIDIVTARKVLSASIDRSGDICRPDGRGKQFESEIAAFRQKVLETKTGAAQAELLAKIKDLLVRHNDILRSFVPMRGAAGKLLLATATDGEAEYLDSCKRTSQDILKKAQEFDGLVDELKQLREDADKTEMNDKPDAEVEKPKADEKLKTEEDPKTEEKPVPAETKEKKALEEHINWLRNKIALETELPYDNGVRLRDYEKKLEEDLQRLEALDKKLANEVKVDANTEHKEEKLERKEEKKDLSKEAESQKAMKLNFKEIKDPLAQMAKEFTPQQKKAWSPKSDKLIIEQLNHVAVPKQEPIKNDLIENRLDGFVSNGVFRQDCLPTFDVPYMDTEEFHEKHKQHSMDVDRKLREDIIPNWKSLTNRLEALRHETMKALGVGSESEEWFKHWHPEFDCSSDSFVEKVRGEKIAGKNVKDAEDAILAACQVKTTGKLYAENGQEINLNIVVGGMPLTPVANTSYIYIGKEKAPLTKSGVQEVIDAFCKGKRLGGGLTVWQNDEIGSILGVVSNVSSVNTAFQSCVVNSDALDKLLNEEVGLLGHFTNNERNEIEELIRKAVIDPIKKGKNFWDIEPKSLMRNFTKLCDDGHVANAADVVKVVRKLVKAQVDGHFALKAPVGGACLISNGKTASYDKEMLPAAVITGAVKLGMGIRQHGRNNCFMVSIVNALLGNENGRKILMDCFGNKDGKYHFKDKTGKPFTLADKEVSNWDNYTGMKGAGMSKLERVIWAGWLEARRLNGEFANGYNLGYDYPGNQCESSDVAFLFGLDEVDDRKGTIDGVSLPESKLVKWVNVKNHLATGNIAVVHQGTGRSGHYEAVTGAESKESKYFTCCDSAGSDASFGFGDIQSEADKSKSNLRRIILLTLPKV